MTTPATLSTSGHCRASSRTVPGFARIDDGGDFRARGEQVGGGGPTVVVVGEHDGAAARSHGKTIQVAAHGAGQHHAGAIVVAERQWPLDRAGREHGLSRDDAPDTLPRFEVPAARPRGR